METPLFIVSKQEIISKLKELDQLFDEVYYSHKSNPFVGKLISKITHKLSLNHINSLRDLDNKTLKNSLYYLQGESKKEIKDIVDKGLSKFIVDNENDLRNLLSVCDPSLLFLRVKYREHTFYTGKYFVYGMSWKKIPKIIERYKLRKFDLGLHFHKKTQNVGEWYVIKDLFNIFNKDFLEKNIKYINLGGGIPTKYVNSSPSLESIKKSIIEFKEEINNLNIYLISEPGRYIAAPSVRLHTKVINSYDDTLVVNASIYNAYMDTYLLHHRLPIIDEVEEGKFCYTIKGCTLDSLDIFRYKACFEKEKGIGDEIVFLNVGAYNFHTEFNFLDRIPYKVVEKF